MGDGIGVSGRVGLDWAGIGEGAGVGLSLGVGMSLESKPGVCRLARRGPEAWSHLFWKVPVQPLGLGQ